MGRPFGHRRPDPEAERPAKRAQTARSQELSEQAKKDLVGVSHEATDVLGALSAATGDRAENDQEDHGADESRQQSSDRESAGAHRKAH